MSHGLDGAWDSSQAGEGGSLSDKETPDGERIYYENCCCRIGDGMIPNDDWEVMSTYSTDKSDCYILSFKRECEALPQTWVAKKGQKCRPHSAEFYELVDAFKKHGGTILSDPPAEVDCTTRFCCPSYLPEDGPNPNPGPTTGDQSNCCDPYIMIVCYPKKEGGIGPRPRYDWPKTQGTTGGSGHVGP